MTPTRPTLSSAGGLLSAGLLLFASVAITSVALVAPAFADDHEGEDYKNYFEVQSGIAHVPNQTVDGNTGHGSVQPDELGFHVGGAFGRQLTDLFRAEFAVSYREGDIDQAGFVRGQQADGKSSLLAFMINAYADFPLGGITPWIGFGIGGGSYKLDVFQPFPGAFDVDDEDAVFVYNAMVGASVPLTDVVTLNVGYRYIALAGDRDTDAVVGADPGPPAVAATPTQLDSEFDAHEAVLGLRFRF